jgi:hypothetical protein
MVRVQVVFNRGLGAGHETAIEGADVKRTQKLIASYLGMFVISLWTVFEHLWVTLWWFGRLSAEARN